MKLKVLIPLLVVVCNLPVYSQSNNQVPRLFFHKSPQGGIIREYESKKKYEFINPKNPEQAHQNPKDEESTGSENDLKYLIIPDVTENFSDRMKYLDPNGNFPMTIIIPKPKEHYPMTVK